MRWTMKSLRLAVVDAGGVDADARPRGVRSTSRRAASSPYDGKCRLSVAPGVSSPKYDLRSGQRFPQPVRSRTIVPAAIAPWRDSQCADVVRGQAVVGVRGRAIGDVDHDRRRDEPLQRDLIDGVSFPRRSGSAHRDACRRAPACRSRSTSRTSRPASARTRAASARTPRARSASTACCSSYGQVRSTSSACARSMRRPRGRAGAESAMSEQRAERDASHGGDSMRAYNFRMRSAEDHLVCDRLQHGHLRRDRVHDRAGAAAAVRGVGASHVHAGSLRRRRSRPSSRPWSCRACCVNARLRKKMIVAHGDVRSRARSSDCVAAFLQHDWRLYVPAWIASLIGFMREFPRDESARRREHEQVAAQRHVHRRRAFRACRARGRAGRDTTRT